MKSWTDLGCDDFTQDIDMEKNSSRKYMVKLQRKINMRKKYSKYRGMPIKRNIIDVTELIGEYIRV